MNLLVPALGGIGLLLLMGGSSKTASAGSSTTPTPKAKTKTNGGFEIPPIPSGAGAGAAGVALNYQTRIADAISRGDLDALYAIANEEQAAGLTTQADQLRMVALSLQTLKGKLQSGAIPNPPSGQGTTPVTPSGQGTTPVTPSPFPLPAGVPASSTAEQSLLVAQAMAVDLRNTSRYKENQVLVKRYQDQEGLVVDGKYGPKTALSLAKYGIIPPRPRYWVKKTVQIDKQQYAAEMLARAVTDPSRAADWTAASKVQNDPIG